MEQASLAYYLVEKGYEQTAFPIQNIQSEWITEADNNKYIVVKLLARQNQPRESPGKRLAVFHYINRSYGFQPQYVSSYGQWKKLWVEKLGYFEKEIVAEAEANPTKYHKLLMDILPYLIGISENAIQYMVESEHEPRFDEGDQGTICFQRYQEDGLATVILPEYLVYDHRVRDLAEYVREQLLSEEQGDIALENIDIFLSDYEHVYPLSPLSFRLLYARLIFPIQLFDFIEEGFASQDYQAQYEALEQLLIKQDEYEARLSRVFSKQAERHETLVIPSVDWLS